jgi:putative endopeptidase
MTYFVDEEDKKDILALCNEIRDTYREILEGEEWLSEEGKKQALAKLDNMTFSVLKPDTLIDASYLSVDRDVSFLDANAKIVVNTIKHNSGFVGSKRVPGDWRYDIRTEIPSTVQNAFYYGSFNQFFIMSGFIGDTTYRRDMSKEEKLGLLGEVIGHELTHGFDPLGIQYDKDGNMVVTDENPYGWLPKEDYEAFMERADRIAAYFNNINAFPYAKIDGNKVWGEAAADIGGMTITLKIAEKYDDFDYDRYFRCHSELWKEQVTVTSERYDISNEHPLRYLRINAVVQQFDKFNETYDIKEGDPMYLAPEDRIKIW